MNGPTESPAYTEASVMPRAHPRRAGGKTAVTIATDVVNIMAPPAPWIILQIIRAGADQAIVAHSEPAVSRIIPVRKRRFLPYISAIRPNGTMQMAVARM